MKRGLILEGGAMRGIFSAGVMDVLMENKIEFEGAVGVSAGAAFGCNYKSGQAGRVIRYNCNYVQDKRYCGWGVLLKTGNMFSTEFCYGEVPLKLDVFDFETYEKNPMEFFVVATDVETGEAVYHRFEGRGDHCFDWIRASASMPLVSQIVEIEGKKYLDGGVADSVPVDFFKAQGYERCLVVLTQPRGYIKGKNKMLPLARLIYRKYPKFIETMAKRHLVYNETLAKIEELESRGELLVIRPDYPIPVKKVEKDPEKLRAAYEMGRKACESRLEEIKAYLDRG